jgi:cytochrome P450
VSSRIAQVIADKRRTPGDDLLTALIQAEDNGDVLTDDELTAQVVLLYVAGHETTVNLIANGTIALLRNPEQFARLAANPTLDANAVEELLRYDSPVQQSRRITLAPYEVGGRVIPAGRFVIAGLASANRDEAFWGADADQLRLDRPNAKAQVSFGGGVHHCLGAALARLEGRVALGRLVRRFPDLALAARSPGTAGSTCAARSRSRSRPAADPSNLLEHRVGIFFQGFSFPMSLGGPPVRRVGNRTR